MSESISVGSLKALLRFPFQGRDWPGRFIIGSVLIAAGYFIPIIPVIFALGYLLQVLRRAVQGEEPALPAWDDWGKLGGDGLRLFAVTLVYTLPGALVVIGGFVIYFAGVFGLAARAQYGDPNAALAYMASLGLFLVALFVGMLLSILGAIPLPMAAANLAARRHTSAGFQVGEVTRLIVANKLGYLVAWVVVMGLYALWYVGAMLLYYTLCLCCLLPLLAAPVSFYLGLVGAALFGQIYRESQALIGARWGGEPGSGDALPSA